MVGQVAAQDGRAAAAEERHGRFCQGAGATGRRHEAGDRLGSVAWIDGEPAAQLHLRDQSVHCGLKCGEGEPCPVSAQEREVGNGDTGPYDQP